MLGARLTQTSIPTPLARRRDVEWWDERVPIVTWLRQTSDQWKLSPQAQEPPAFGLSMVKPCCWIVSTKSIVAPVR